MRSRISSAIKSADADDRFISIVDALPAFRQGLETVQGRCRISPITEDLHRESMRESMRLRQRHEQALCRPLPHHQLVQLQRGAREAGIAADRGGQRDDLARVAWRAARTAGCLLRCRHPVLPVDQGAVQASVAPGRRDGGQPAAPGRAGLAGALRRAIRPLKGSLILLSLHPEPQAEDPDLPAPVSPSHRAVEPAGRQ